MKTYVTKLNSDLKPGWVEGLTNEQHHAMSCISSSKLKVLADGTSMETFYKMCITKEVPWETSKEKIFGTLAHMLILEPERFEKQVMVPPVKKDSRKNDYKDFLQDLCKPDLDSLPIEKKQELLAKNALKNMKTEEFSKKINEQTKLIDDLENKISTLDKKEAKIVKDNIKSAEKLLKELEKEYKNFSGVEEEFEVVETKDGGIINGKGEEIFLITQNEMDILNCYRKNIASHKIKGVLDKSIKEMSGVVQDFVTGLWMSLRPDARYNKSFIDPKTIAGTLTDSSIQTYMDDYSLHIQAAHYLECGNLIDPGRYENFFFLFLSKKAPYEIAFIQLNQESVEKGRQERRVLLNMIVECENKGHWPPLDAPQPGQKYRELGLAPYRLRSN